MQHNDKNQGHGLMMWLMMIPCFLLLGIALIGGKIWNNNNWQLLSGFGVMILVHVIMMKFMHGSGDGCSNHDGVKDDAAKSKSDATLSVADENNSKV